MKFHFAYRCLIGLSVMGTMAHALAAPVVLTKAGLATYIVQSRVLDADKLCLVGESMDPDGDLQDRGYVAVFSLASNKVLWQKTIEAPGDNAAMHFVGCASDGKSIYVAANVDTHSEQSLTQSLGYVYQFDHAGKTLAKAEIDTKSRNAYIYDIDAGDDGVNVAGLATDTTEKKQTNAIFFAKYTSLAKAPALTRLNSGGFLDGTVAKLAGKTLYLAGNFAPASKSLDNRPDDYAVSKLVAEKYQFSVRPLKAKADAIASAITQANEIVSLGYVGKETNLTAVGPDGKVRQDQRVGSAYCETKSFSADADSAFAVRIPCDKPDGEPKLLAINRANGKETLVKGISGKPVHVVAFTGKIGIVTKQADGSLVLQIAAQDR
jgi:hypothetical protein